MDELTWTDIARILREGAIDGLHSLAAYSPRIVAAIILIVLFIPLSKLVSRITKRAFVRFSRKPMLAHTIGKVVATFVFVLGLYFSLEILGLTQLAVTVVGGTGVAGLIIGFAFRDIAENFLAGIILSIQQPFKIGDTIFINSHLGIVERMTFRCTVIMNFDGDHVQIPNSIVFKNDIRNLSTNPFRRADFIVGIGYDDDILSAQAAALEVLESHDAVLQKPEPWVLIESLGTSTVNVKVYFWIDGHKNNYLKVKSSVIRLIKTRFANDGISMPDEAREVVFPNGVPVRMIGELKSDVAEGTQVARTQTSTRKPEMPIASSGEGDLSNDDHQIREQIAHSDSPEPGVNLLSDDISHEKVI